MARTAHLPIWKVAIDLAVHLEKAVARFPRSHKYSLGSDLCQCAQRLCRLIVRANALAFRGSGFAREEVSAGETAPIAAKAAPTNTQSEPNPCRSGLAREEAGAGDIAHALIAQDGHFKTGFKRRVLQLWWYQPMPPDSLVLSHLPSACRGIS